MLLINQFKSQYLFYICRNAILTIFKMFVFAEQNSKNFQNKVSILLKVVFKLSYLVL